MRNIPSVRQRASAVGLLALVLLAGVEAQKLGKVPLGRGAGADAALSEAEVRCARALQT